jgi:hypothetical protein
MAYVTTDQIERARQINILYYVLTHEANNVKRVGNAFRLKGYESLAISDKGFYWHSHGIGGKTALDYLTDIRGYGLVEAVCRLLGESPQEHANKTDTSASVKHIIHNIKKSFTTADEQPTRTPFVLPLRHKVSIAAIRGV